MNHPGRDGDAHDKGEVITRSAEQNKDDRVTTEEPDRVDC